MKQAAMNWRSAIGAFLAWILFLLPGSAHAGNVVQTFFLPLPETQVRASLLTLQSGTGSTMDAVTSIVVTGNNTRIYYDHWEDGYEVDIENPVQSTTQVWGDNNALNGIAPMYGTDVFTAGDVVSLRNLVTLPRNPSQIRFDGRDKIGATKALAVSRASFATSPGTVLAGAVEVSSVRDYGLVFEAPVGQNVSANSMFEVVSLFVMASENGTNVLIDADNNGINEIATTLNQGESYHLVSGVLRGASVVADKPVQAHIITGDIGANYESRWYTLYPLDDWSDSYFTPVGTASDGDDTYIFLYNPSGGAITVNYETQIGTGNVNVPAGGTTSFLMPQNSGAHFFSPGNPFFAIATVGAEPTANNVHDWGFSLLPEDALTTRAVVGWGPGSGDLSANGSPVWVTAAQAAVVFIDYDGDPTTGPLTDVNGDQYDLQLNLAALESRRVFDPDRDQTGMTLYTLDGTLITAAWGQDPASAAPGNPFLDLGTTVLPLPIPIIIKSSELIVDMDMDGLVDPIVDVLEYTISVNNEGFIILGNVLVIDAPPAPLVYVPNSTTVDGNPLADDGMGTAFPLDAPGYTIPLILPDGFVEFTYQATVQVGATSIQNSVTADGGGTPVTDDEIVPVDNPGQTNCALSYTDSGGSGVSFYIVGQLLYVTVTDGDANTSAASAQSMTVQLSNPSTFDVEDLVLTETGINTGIFRNTVGFPFSTSSGLSVQDGTLYALVGHVIEADRTDPVYGDQCNDTATISPTTDTKHLYLDTDGGDGDTTGDLDRVHPGLVTPVDMTTSSSVTLGGTSTITFDNATDGQATNSNTITFSHTTGSLTNGLLLVGVSWQQDPAARTISSITYNGVGLTQVPGGVVGIGTEMRAELYYMMNPPSGAHNVVVTMSGTLDGFVAGAITLAGVHQTPASAFGTVATFVQDLDGTSRTPSINVASAVGDLVVDLVAYDEGVAHSSAGGGQTIRWIETEAADTTGVSTTKAGAAGTTTMSHTFASNDQHVQLGVAVKPAVGTTTATFTQTPAMASALSMPIGGAVSVVSCINVVSGVMPNPANVTATLKRNMTTFLTDTTAAYSAADMTNCNGGASLSWSGALGAAVNVAATETVVLEVTTAVAGVTFQLQYDSNTRVSKVSLPTTTVINVDSIAVYDAAYSGGGILTNGNNGQTYYVRVQVSDPFGFDDITNLSMVIDGPGMTCDLSIDPVSVVNTTAGTKTFEYVWATGACEGNYDISVIAEEGYEGLITDTAATPFTLSALDLGTPSVTEFTTGNNGPHTLTYAPDEQVCMRVTDLDQNTNPAAVENITVNLSSSPSGDDQGPITLTETGINTGVFTACLPASSTIPGMDNDGTIYAPTGTVLTVTYVDPTDPTDTGNDTATVTGAGTTVAISKTRILPSDLVAVVGETVRFDLTITNTGANPLPVVTVTDTFPTACLTFSSASPAPNSTMPAGTLTWNDITGGGSLASGASTTIQVFFTAGAGTCSPSVNNSASVSGTAAAGPATAPIEVTRPEITVTKTRTFPAMGPAAVGTTVTFSISVTNTGTTAIDNLPLSDDYSTCLEFSLASIVPDAAGGGTIVWNDLTGMGSLLPAGSINVTVSFTVVGACTPANNVADVSFADDINNDPVPPDSDDDSINTVAASISGQVRDDTDGDGDFADPDSGIPGVTVRLYTDPNGDGDPSDGVLVGLQVTNASGNYTFTNLGAGDYTVVQENLITYYSTADVFGLNDNRIPVEITTITSYPGNDFLDSTFQSSTVNGRVYHDVNGDGDYDAGIDVPQEGVEVVITDAYGLQYSVFTNASGLWSQVVPPGNTTVDVDESTLIFMTDPTLTTNVSGEGIDSNVVYAPQGGSVTDNNGFIEAVNIGTIQGRVYHDVNGDGDYDPGIDVPLNGVEVRITDSNGGVYVVFTDPDGNYSKVVAAGPASVDVIDSTLPPGGSLTVNTFGEGNDPTAVVIPPNGTATDNTGYTWPPTMGWVSGVIYVDNGNGMVGDMADVLLGGIDVQITDALGNVHVVTTDVNGYFIWPVPPGSTTVDVVDLSLPPRATLTIDTFGEGNDSTVVLVPPNTVAIDNTGYVISPTVGFVQGTVFEDTNSNGTYEVGVDVPLSGVDVVVTDANGGIYTLTTDANGYFIQMVPAGATDVDVDDSTLPAGATLAMGGGNSDPTTVMVPAAGFATDNTGYTLPAALGLVEGTIYLDNDNSGTFNAGDTVLPNVDVEITDSLGGVHTVTTDGSGYFNWPVPAGNTTVDVVDATLPVSVTLTTDASNEGSDPTVVFVPSAGVGTDNTGYVESVTGSVNGTVFEDTNGNGTYQVGVDIPLPGVDVEITDVNGGVYTVTTDANGFFSQVVPAGATDVDVVDATLPSGSSLAPGGGNSDPTVVAVPANGTATDNTGYLLPATLGTVNGTIFLDNDNSGTFNGGDTPLANVDVEITDSDGVVHTVTTNGSGFFSLQVPPGSTDVDVVDSTLPPGVTLTTDASNEGSDPTTVNVPSGGTATDNTGYVLSPNTGTITGTVFEDTNGNGTYQVGVDIPLSGVDVEITDVIGGIYTVTTDANGFFSQVVPAGATDVDVVDATLPTSATLVMAGGNSDPTLNIVVPAGGTANDDTGYTVPVIHGDITGRVYLDNDSSGTFNGGDTVLPNVDVEITDSMGGVHTVTTDANGQFLWPVPPGNTLVDVVDATLPVGATLTTDASNEGSDPTIVNVPSGGTGNDNTGYVIPPTTGLVFGVVFIDTNGNGTYQLGVDSPIAGVDVRVTASNGAVYNLTTNGSGAFSQVVPSGMTNVDVVDATLPMGAMLVMAGGNSDPTDVNVPANGSASDNTAYALAVPTNTSTATRTNTHTATATRTNTPVNTNTPGGATLTRTPTRTFTRTSTATRSPTRTATPSPTRTATRTRTPTSPRTFTPTRTPNVAACPPVLKKIHAGTVNPGGEIVYTITWSNPCRFDLPGVVVTDALPNGLTLVGATSSDGVVTTAGNVVTIDVGNLPKGPGGTAEIVVDIDEDVAPDTVIQNQAVLTDDTGNHVTAEDSIRVRGTATSGGGKLVCAIRAQVYSRPGTYVRYTTRYKHGSANNSLALTLSPTNLDLLDFYPPPAESNDSLIAWDSLSSTSGLVKADTRVSITAPDGAILLSRAVVDDGRGNVAVCEHQSIVRRSERISVALKAQSKTKPGRTITYVARYANVVGSNEMTMVLPDGLSLIGSFPAATSQNGNTLTFVNLPVPAGLVKVRAVVGSSVASGDVLAASVSITDDTGDIATSKHSTTVSIAGIRGPGTGTDSNSNLTLSGQKTSRVGSFITYLIRYQNLAAGQSLHLDLPADVTRDATVPIPNSFSGTRLTWRGLASSGNIKVDVQVGPGAAGQTIVAQATLESSLGVQGTANLSTTVSDGASSSSAASLSMIVPRNVTAGLTADVTLDVRDLSGPGTLRVRLPPEMRPQLTIPAGSVGSDGQVVWNNLRDSSGGFKVRVLIDRLAVSGSGMRIEAELIDGLGARVTATGTTSVR